MQSSTSIGQRTVFKFELSHVECAKFFDQVGGIEYGGALKYAPIRALVALKWKQTCGSKLIMKLRNCLTDRECGIAICRLPDDYHSRVHQLLFLSGLSLNLCRPTIDGQTGSFFSARLAAGDHDETRGLGHIPYYKTEPLHSDGLPPELGIDEVVAFQLVELAGADGGENVFVHIDDCHHLLSLQNARPDVNRFCVQLPALGSSDDTRDVPTRFFHQHRGHAILYLPRNFVRTETAACKDFFAHICDAIDCEFESAKTRWLMRPGNLVVLNNTFWLHGRAPFHKARDFKRLMYRVKGPLVVSDDR